MYRASFDTRRFGAVEASVSLRDCHLLRETFVYFFRARGSAVDGIELRHLHALDSHTLLWFHRLAEVCTPRGVAVCERIVAFFSIRGCGFFVCYDLVFCFRLCTCVWLTFVNPVLHLLALNAFEGVHAARHLIPVDLIAIELRSIDADETCLATDGQAAGTTHTRTIDHDGVEGYIVGNIIFLGEKRSELHHHWRTDGEHFVDMLTLDNLFYANGDDAFLSIRTIIGHDDHLITVGSDVIFHNDEVLGSSCEDGDNPVACIMKCREDREDSGNAYAASGAYHGTIFLNL